MMDYMLPLHSMFSQMLEFLNHSASADYIIPDLLPEYSIALNLYFGVDNCGNVICEKYRFRC